MERLFLFSLIWTFGGLLTKEERKPMNDLIRNLSTALVSFCSIRTLFLRVLIIVLSIGTSKSWFQTERE